MQLKSYKIQMILKNVDDMDGETECTENLVQNAHWSSAQYIKGNLRQDHEVYGIPSSQNIGKSGVDTGYACSSHRLQALEAYCFGYWENIPPLDQNSNIISNTNIIQLEMLKAIKGMKSEIKAIKS